MEQDNSIKDPECPVHWDASPAPNVPRLIRSTRRPKWQGEMLLVTVDAIETRRNQGVKKIYGRMRRCFISFFMYHHREFKLEICDGWMVSSILWISVDKQLYSGRHESFGKTHKFWLCESEQCKNVTELGFATVPSLNLSERWPICSNHDQNYCRWQQMPNEQYSKISLNDASTICGFVRMVIK